MNNLTNNPKNRHLLNPAWIVFLVLGIILLLGACTTSEPPFSEVVIVTPADTSPPPPSPIPTTTPVPTSFPEGTIAWGILSEETSPEDLERIEMYETWSRALSQASGLDIVLVPYPQTDMETLEALRDGRIHMTTMHPLVYLVGNERGWVEPGPIWGEQVNQPIAFISHTDTGFLPGEPPEVFQQLEGSRVCWPETKNMPPHRKRFYGLPSYILPLGLLRLNGVENVLPVPIEGPSHQDYEIASLDIPIFRGLCDFAAVPVDFPDMILTGRFSIYVDDPDEYDEKMQILYITEPIYPLNALFSFSPTLPEAVRERLSLALLTTLPPYEDLEFNLFNETLFDEFRRIVLASGVDLQSYLSAPVDEP